MRQGSARNPSTVDRDLRCMQLSTLVRGVSALPLMKVVMLGWSFMEDLAAVTQRAGYSYCTASCIQRVA